jgi:hypothetical protein
VYRAAAEKNELSIKQQKPAFLVPAAAGEKVEVTARKKADSIKKQEFFCVQ